MTETIYLREAAARGDTVGHVAIFTGPLPAGVQKRWDDGDLIQVTRDGDPWEDSDVLPEAPVLDVAVEEVPAGPQATFAETDPARPRGNGSQEAWAVYAVAVGAVSEDEAAGMSRDDLIAASPAAAEA